MRHLFTILLLILGLTHLSYAQMPISKVNWQTGKNWEEIKQMAERLHKPIFVDCYTTWCGWCHWLDKNIYTNDSVGQKLNTDYVCLRLQFDSSQQDNEEIKNWYQTTHQFIKDYHITSYPTLLFLEPDGTLISKSVGAESKNPITSFLKIIRDAQNPEKQYNKIEKRLQSDPDNVTLMRSAISLSIEAGEQDRANALLKKYLSLHLNDFDKAHVLFLKKVIHNVDAPYFREILSHKKEYDSALGNTSFSNQLMKIIFNREAYPVIFSGRGQSANSHYYLPEPNWAELHQKLYQPYPEEADQVLLFSKVDFFEYRLSWGEWFTELKKYIEKYDSEILPEDLHHWSRLITENFPDDKEKQAFAHSMMQ